ncbi:MAG: F0F1 ATP synthase subunit gamma [Clostridia bacterium]|nr:F0F1 ATP synthase subunit gamma [Clostridia bacterium]
MPSLGELKKRLKSARTIEQLSGAMRSAATAKYLRLSSVLTAFTPYAEAVREMSGFAGLSGGDTGAHAEKHVFILLSGNHGLCGGYHQELFNFFTGTALGFVRDPVIITCGKKAYDFCVSRGLPVLRSFEMPDVPACGDARAIVSFLKESFTESGCVKISVVYQKFFNMLKSRPVSEVFPIKPAEDTEKADPDGVLFIPDRPTAADELYSLSLNADMYKKLLSAASAAQAATVVAMRSAYDNAKSSISGLESRINRLRQAAVTASVLETSVGIKEQL